MRLLRLHFDEQTVIEFHPYVTVAARLAPEYRQAVRAAFVEAVAGRAGGRRGLIEAHDLVLDLDDESLALLELGNARTDVVVSSEDLPGTSSSDLSRQLRAAERRLDLLEEQRRDAEERLRAAQGAAEGAVSAVDDARAVVAATETPEPVEDDDAASATSEIDALVEAAETEAAALAAPAAEAAGALARARRELADAESQAQALAARVAETQSAVAALRERRAEVAAGIDDDAGVALAEARDALVQAEQRRLARVAERRRIRTEERRAAAARAAAERATAAREAAEREAAEQDAAAEEADRQAAADRAASDEAQHADAERSTASAALAVQLRRDELESEIDEIQASIALQASFDAEMVRVALDSARAASVVRTMVPSARALGLADRLESLGRRIDAGTDLERPPQSEIAAASHAVATAEAQYRELEAELRGPRMAAGDRQELESLHATVVALADEVEESRFRKGKIQVRLEEAKAAETEMLGRFGYDSYTDFLTGGPAAALSSNQADQLQQARVAVLTATARLSELEGQASERAAVDAAIVDRAELRSQAVAMLGPDAADLSDDGLIESLVSLRVEGETSDLVRPLVRALDQVGLSVAEMGLDDDEIIRLAADWVDEYQRAEEERSSQAARLAELETALAELPQPLLPEVEGAVGASAEPLAVAAGDEPGEPAGHGDPAALDGGDQDAADDDGDGALADERAVVVEDDDQEDDDHVDLVAALAGIGLPDVPVAEAEEPTTGEAASSDASDGSDVPTAPGDGAVDATVDDDVFAGDDETDEPDEADLAERRDLEGEIARAEAAVAAVEAAQGDVAELDAELTRIEAGSPSEPDETSLQRLRDQVVAAEARHDEAEARRSDAEAALIRHRATRRTVTPAEPDASVAEAAASAAAALADAESRHAMAEDAVAEASEALDDVRARMDSVVAEVASLRKAVDDSAEERVPVEEVEFYLLARLASLRDVCFGGSLPLVIDGALDELPDRDLAHVLNRVERMAGTVQILHLTDDDRIVAWAEQVGERRAAVVAPVNLASVE